MSKELTTTKAPADYIPAALRDERLEPLVSSLCSGLISVQGRDSLERLPTYQERTQLENRIGAIAAVLRPASMAEAEMRTLGAALGVMLGGWLNNRADAQSTVNTYKLLLKDLPLWAVLAACRDFTDGQAYEDVDGERRRLSPDFAPSAPRIKTVARSKLDDVVAERERIRRLLAVKVTHNPEIDEAMRAQVGEQLRQLAGGMRAKNDAERAAEQAVNKAKADEARGRAALFREQAEARILADYERAGVVPVRNAAGHLIALEVLPEEHRHPVQGSDR